MRKSLIDRVPAGVRQAAIYGFALLAAKAVSLLMVPVYTHYLMPADYGRLDVLQTLANLLSIVIAFGLGDTLFRFAGTDKDDDARRRTTANIFGFALLLGVISLLLTQATAPWIAAALPGDVTVMQTRMILGSLAVTGVILVPMSWFRMRDRAVAFMSASAGYAVVQAIGAAIALWLGYGIDGVLFAGLLTASGLSGLLLSIQWRDTGVRLERAFLKRHAHFGGVMVFSGIAAFILDSFDRWILADAVGPAEMAMYALAAKLGLIAAVACQPFAMWWMPRRFKVLSETDGAARCTRTIEIGLILAAAAGLSVAGGGPLIITLMTPAEYHAAIQYVPWLAALAVFAAATRLINMAVLSREGTMWPIAIDGVAALMALGLYLLLIPMLGGMGAIIATALTLTTRFIAYVVLGNRVVRMSYRWGRLALPIGSAIAGLFAVWSAPGVWMPMVYALGFLGLLAALAVVTGLLPAPTRLRRPAARSAPT